MEFARASSESNQGFRETAGMDRLEIGEDGGDGEGDFVGGVEVADAREGWVIEQGPEGDGGLGGRVRDWGGGRNGRR